MPGSCLSSQRNRTDRNTRKPRRTSVAVAFFQIQRVRHLRTQVSAAIPERAVLTSPTTMRHIRIVVSHYGGPDQIRVVEEDCPEPKKGEVRVRVLAAGV